jgi:hypothetical protein
MGQRLAVVILVLFTLHIIPESALGSGLNLKKPLRSSDYPTPSVPTGLKTQRSHSHPLGSPGIVMDSTYYDWQANGGFDDHLTMCVEFDYVLIHAVWTIAHKASLNDRCLMAYYCWSGAYGEDPPLGFCIFTTRSGPGSLSMLSKGALVACSDANFDSLPPRACAIADAFPCVLAFGIYTTSSDTVGIRPRITVNSDDSIVMTGIGLEILDNITNSVMWTKFSGGWRLFCSIAPDWMHNDMEPPTIHSGSNGLVGVVIPDLAGAVRYFESTDYAETFDVLTIAEADTANLPSTIDSTAARLGWINSDIIYIGEEPHVVWSAGQGAKIGDEYSLIDFKSTIFHWSQSSGIDTVVVAQTQSADPSRPDYVPTPYNHLSVDWPSIGLAVDGQSLVVAYTAFNPDDIDSTAFPMGYVDIWMTSSPDNGETWSDPQNVTNPDGSILGWDDRYPSIAKVNMDNLIDPGKDVYMIYQSDDLAGTFVQGTESSENMDYVKFVGVDLSEVGIGNGGGKESSNIPRALSLSQNYPNPFNPSTTIEYEIPATSGKTPVRILIYDIRGRLVKKLVDREKAPGRYQVHWDGLDGRERHVSSGAYLYKIEAGDITSTRKMLLVR